MTEAEIAPLVQRALKGLRYGHVQLVVHEGQLVRIERVEKIRLMSEPCSHENNPTELLGGQSRSSNSPTPPGGGCHDEERVLE